MERDWLGSCLGAHLQCLVAATGLVQRQLSLDVGHAHVCLGLQKHLHPRDKLAPEEISKPNTISSSSPSFPSSLLPLLPLPPLPPPPHLPRPTHRVATMMGVSPRLFWAFLSAAAGVARRNSKVRSCMPWDTSFMQEKWRTVSPSLSTARQSAPMCIRNSTTDSWEEGSKVTHADTQICLAVPYCDNN